MTVWLDARTLLCEASKTLSSEQARPIWEQWARHQYQYGNLKVALEVEAEMALNYPEGTSAHCASLCPVKRAPHRKLTHAQTPRSSASPLGTPWTA